MRGKFVWADGYLKTAEGFENTKARPLHHRYLIEALADEGKIEWPAKNCLCGWYSQDPFNPDIINGREGAKWGVTPTLEECLQMIKEEKPKVAKYDYAATMEYLAAEYTEAEGEEILRIIRETGGGTFIKKATNSYDPLYLGRGYYVSEEGKEQKLPLAMASPDIVLDYANSTIPTGEMLGTWVDGNDLYLDCSRWFDDYDQAIEFGKANHQVAIWDAGNNAEIRLDDIVTSDGAIPAKWAWVANWIDDGVEYLIRTEAGIQEDYQAVLDKYPGTPLKNYPGPVSVPGIGKLDFGAHSEIQGLAENYMNSQGLSEKPDDYVDVDPNLAEAIAWDYENAEDNPNDPQIQASYDAFIRETMEQYKMLVNAGYTFEFYPEDGTDPYPNSPREAVLDLYKNKHMYVFPTDSGFGSLTQQSNHALLGDSGVKWNGKPVTYNDIFRAVHDVFGHAKEGVGFRWDGEENAWRQHLYMYSELARPAMTAETRGQNSWVNFGPYGELKNQRANQDETIYADQKMTILPEWAFDTYSRWVLAATSEDTEPVGKQVGFIQDPHEELYPCLFRGEDYIPSEVIETLKNHVLEPLSERFEEPDSWIMFSIYGSGISYNWDESGDMDIQMWVDIDEFLRYNFDEDLDQDELLSQVRMIVQQHNFPAFKDLGLTYEDCPGDMLIQYYPKPGTGSKEENLASKPYACYDMDTGTWLQKPIVLKPKFYGETFLMLMPKAEEIAKQAEALLADYKRDVLNWEFWDLLYRKNKKKEFKEQLDATISDAEDRKEGIKNMFQGIFGGRAEAYSPGGRGVKDERDIMQKLLEVWGTFQDLKHYAREPLPWEIEIPEPKQSMAERTGDAELDSLIDEFMEENYRYLCGGETDPENAMDYRKPEDAYGECYEVSEFFARWLNDKGIPAALPEDEPVMQDMPWTQEGRNPHPFDYGYQDRPGSDPFGYPDDENDYDETEQHHVVIVRRPSGTFMIDFTAAQYGYTEFPMVQRLAPGGWERKWGYKRLANFNIVSADVYELAQNAWKNLAEQQFAPYIMKLDLDNMEDEKMKSDLQSINREFMLVMTLLLKQNPETFKFFPWLWREYKSAMQKRLHGPLDNQTIMSNNRNHVVDILKQATALMEKIRTDPRPESKVPNVMADFKPGETDGFRQLEAWTYENATKYQQADLEKDEPVFDLGDGWKIVKVHPDNLAWEGDQMGHCVGGYCDLVESGDSLIYSLRDPKNMPHATIEIAGKFAGGMRDVDGQQWNTTGPVDPLAPTDENDAWEVVQIQGKQNEAPMDAYKTMIKKWFTSLKQNGINVKWAGNQWNDEDGPEIYIRGDGDFQDWLGRGEPLPRPGDLDEYGLPKIIDFSFDAKHTILTVAIALVQSDAHSFDNLLQSEHSVQEILNGLMELINYQKELWPESSDRVDQEVEAGIEAAYQWYDEKWDKIRDMNFDYTYETMKSIWEYEYPGESWEDAWANSDPRTEAVQEQAEKYLDEEITAPYKDGLNLLKGLQAAIGVGEPVTAAVKTAIWSDIVEKATRYLNEGRVQMQNNMPDHSIATVRGDTGDWTTEIWRQDPSRPNTLSGWSCTCPWGEHSWGRTRIWKKYEGRPCAHTVVLSWESQRQPWDVDEQGNEQLELFDAQQQPGRSFDQYTQDIPRATPPNPNSPNLQLIEQLSLPGAFSSTQPWWSWQRTTAFLNGGFVRNKVKMIGSDDRGESYIVPRNTVGEVLYSDDNDTIVIFNLESGPLGAHLIRVEETTDKFMAAPGNILDRGPAPRRRAPNA